MPAWRDLFGVTTFDYEREFREFREFLNRSAGQRARRAHEYLQAVVARQRAALDEHFNHRKETDVQS